MMSIDVADVHPIILAGGFGTRLHRVSPDVPKPMIKIQGRPFVEWVVKWVAKAGFSRVTISTFHLSEQFESYFDAQPVEGCSVQCVREPMPLGTGGSTGFAAASSKARPKAWLILNGDSMILCSLHDLLARLSRDGAIVARQVPDAERYGTLDISSTNQLLAFREKDASNKPIAFINAGIYLLSRNMISQIDITKSSSLERDLFPKWLAEKAHIDVLKSDGPFIDIGTEQTLGEADAFIRTNMSHFI